MQEVGELTETMSDEKKRALRTKYRVIRKEMGAEERARVDRLIARRLEVLPEWEKADLVLAYLSFGSEVDTHGLIEAAWSTGKRVAIPYCLPGTRDMVWYRVMSYDGLAKSSFGVLEPNPETFEQVNPESGLAPLAIVPGLAFDSLGYRLGYGGGFYDTFLSGFSGKSVGLCREGQMVESLSDLGVIDAHDLPADVVVSETRVLRPPFFSGFC
jgi:5-formyltetrahydrofolate cyclo-ligase